MKGFLQKSCETARLSHRLTVSLSPLSFRLLSESITEVLEHPFYERLHTLAEPCLLRIAIYPSLQTDRDIKFKTTFCCLTDLARFRKAAPTNLAGCFKSMTSKSKTVHKGGSGGHGGDCGICETWKVGPSRLSGASGFWHSKSCVGAGQGLSAAAVSPSSKWRSNRTTSCKAQIRQ